MKQSGYVKNGGSYHVPVRSNTADDGSTSIIRRAIRSRHATILEPLQATGNYPQLPMTWQSWGEASMS